MTEIGFFAGLRCWLKPGIHTAVTFLLSVVCGLILAAVSTCYGRGEGWYLIRMQFVFAWLLPVTYYDIKARKIPNSWILYGFVAWVVFWLAGGLTGAGVILDLAYSLLGAVFGGGVLLLGARLKHKGIGMGDVKLYLILGLMCSWNGVLSIMAFSLGTAALWSIAGLISGRMKGGDRLPLGPFTCFGLTASVLCGFYW